MNNLAFVFWTIILIAIFYFITKFLTKKQVEKDINILKKSQDILRKQENENYTQNEVDEEKICFICKNKFLKSKKTILLNKLEKSNICEKYNIKTLDFSHDLCGYPCMVRYLESGFGTNVTSKTENK